MNSKWCPRGLAYGVFVAGSRDHLGTVFWKLGTRRWKDTIISRAEFLAPKMGCGFDCREGCTGAPDGYAWIDNDDRACRESVMAVHSAGVCPDREDGCDCDRCQDAYDSIRENPPSHSEEMQ